MTQPGAYFYFLVVWAIVFLVVTGTFGGFVMASVLALVCLRRPLIFVWNVSSPHFRVTFAILGIVGWLMSKGIPAYTHRMDWTSRGLNPDRPGFRPQALILSGTFEYRIDDELVNQLKEGTAYFELRMNGPDHYYCRKWAGREGKVGSWFRVELAMKGFSRSRTVARVGHTTRTTGGGWAGENEVALGRRLWTTSGFVGASTNRPSEGPDKWGNKEEFRHLEPVGPYLVPREIVMTAPGRFEIFRVRKIELTTWPSTNWFHLIKRKHFDRDPVLQGSPLDEPGASGP